MDCQEGAQSQPAHSYYLDHPINYCGFIKIGGIMTKPIDSGTFPKRDSLTWAQHTYYWAKYGLTETGNSDGSPSKSLSDMNLPGSNDRLYARLEQNDVAVEKRPSDDTLIHTGPDGSVVITNRIGWGLPFPESNTLSAELDDRYMCLWEISLASWIPEAPYWAVPL